MKNVRHFLIIAALVLVVTFLVYWGLTSIGLMPAVASAQAVPIDWLFDIDIRLISFFFALIMVPLTYSLIVFRQKDGDESDGQHIEGNTPLEIAWTIIPLILVVALGVIGADNLRQVLAVDPTAIEIKVVGFQWGWQFVYPEGFTTTELHLPINQQVVLKMESRDVLHSFWVPEFRVKQDLVPGRVTDYRITPILAGSYKVRCAELCGQKHAYMEAPVIVEAQDVYTKWVTDQAKVAAAEEAAAAGHPSAERGQKLYNEGGCKACHSLDGAKGIGPTWKGLYESQVPLADGSTVSADDAYITESIKEPNAKVVQGFNPNAMPNFGLKDSQIADLLEFIKTLK
jgi:cytochrome c oxidase subunit II